MSAGTALQAAIVPPLLDLEEVTGVYDGAPARAAFPYVVVDAGTEFDWGHKGAAGREIAVAVTLWDDNPARLHKLADRVEECVGAVATVEDWALVNLRFSRKRVIRDVAGPWAVALDFRARLLKIV